MSPDMIKAASEMMGNMPPEELQKMFKMASSLRGENAAATGGFSDKNVSGSGQTSKSAEPRLSPPKLYYFANCQMFASMMKNMSPETVANMNAAKAQQAMSSLSPEDLDKMVCRLQCLDFSYLHLHLALSGCKLFDGY
ncbi:Outer envelope protein 61 [Linum perenne]